MMKHDKTQIERLQCMLGFFYLLIDGHSQFVNFVATFLTSFDLIGQIWRTWMMALLK